MFINNQGNHYPPGVPHPPFYANKPFLAITWILMGKGHPLTKFLVILFGSRIAHGFMPVVDMQFDIGHEAREFKQCCAEIWTLSIESSTNAWTASSCCKSISVAISIKLPFRPLQPLTINGSAKVAREYVILGFLFRWLVEHFPSST